MASAAASEPRPKRNVGIGSGRPSAPVDWERETRKKQLVQYTMMGITAIFGGLAMFARLRDMQPANSRMQQLLGAASAFWVALVMRVLWSFVWFPKKPSGGGAATAAGGNGTNAADSGSDDDSGAGASAAQRRRRVRRET